MTVRATRHFESSFALIEWFVEERGDELTDEQVEALEIYHDLLVRTSEDLWDASPPNLPKKLGDVPMYHDPDWWRDD